MVPNPDIPYNPAAHGAPTTLLPEEVFGLIDVTTLANIHQYLRESEAQDDIDLATWIQENYLFGVEKGQSTAIIRTAQGFAQLDRAYRRVRSLTNKAQDKWPFFDRNFKEMSSATVRNNARGESAPGVLYPIDSTQKAASATERLGALSMPDTSLAPQLQVLFDSVKPSRHQPYKQEQTPPSQHTPAPSSNLPAAPTQHQEYEKNQICSEDSAQQLSQCADMIPENDDLVMAGSEQLQSATSSIEVTQDSEKGVTRGVADVETALLGAAVPTHAEIENDDSKMDSIRVAGGGKVRGPNGRYLPKDDVLPIPKKTKKPKGKGGRPSLKSALQTDQTHGLQGSSATSLYSQKTDQPIAIDAPPEKSGKLLSEPESVFVEVHTPSTPPPDQKIGEQDTNTTPVVLAVFDTTPPVATENETKNHTASLTEPTPAYLLAAEADPVPSNLDKLPPNSRKILKRKSEPVSQEGERKRGRYGGIVGRPRKSEQRESRKAVQGDRLPQGNADNEVDSSPQMVTRRSARRSAAANLDTSKSTEPTSELAKQSPRLSENQAIAENPPNDENTADMEDVTMSGMEKDKTTSKDTSTPTRSSRKKKSRSSADSQLSSAVSTSKLPTNAPGKQLLKVGLGRSSSKTSGAQSDSHPTPCQPTTSSTASMEQNNTFHDHVANGPSPSISEVQANPPMPNGANRTHPPGHVELFARLTTGNGIMEIPIPVDQINSDEARMIEKYTEWNAQPSAVPVPYDQFRQIFSFAKKE